MDKILCKILETPIESNEVFQFTHHPSHGAQNFFFGAVRGKNMGRDVVAVEYDAAIQLAETTLREIAQEAQTQWGESLKICVLHRIGKLAVGEVSVAIGVSSPHRDESYQASRYVIEEIKKRAPIWKREFYLDGETEWLKGHALCQHEPSALRIHAAVLAGGSSVRMKTDKRFLQIQGIPLVDRVIHLAQEATKSFGGEVLLCGAVPGRKCIPDSIVGMGPLAGLLSALKSVTEAESPQDTWLLVLPVDMPLLSFELLHGLTSEVRHASNKEARAVTLGDFEMPFMIQASCAVRKVVEDVIQSKNPSDRSIRAVLKRLKGVEIELDPKLKVSMLNANFPSDWAHACEEVEKR